MAKESARIGSASVAELQALVNEIAASTGAVGAQVSAIVGDQRADFVYGTANAELDLPMTVDTIVQLGSTTKVFNAALVMSLVDEGKLAVDTPITQYIPDLGLGGKPAPSTLNLRRLLSMSGGLDFGPNDGSLGNDAIGRYVARLNSIPLVYPVGEGFGYSNASVCIAAHAAERVTGLPWDTLLRKRIFEPAGLTHAANASSTGDLPYLRVAVGHTPVQSGQPVKVLRPWYSNDSLSPSGAGSTVAISAHDLASFGEIFINGGKAANGNRLLSEAAVKAMMTPTTSLAMGAPHWGVGENWGLGPTMTKWGDTVVWGHGGSALGGSSILLWFPEKRAVLTFTVNSPTVFEEFAIRITTDFAQALLGVHAPPVYGPPAKAVRVDRPQRLVGTYARAGDRIEITEQAGRLHYKEFNDELAARYKEMSLKVPAGATPGLMVDTDLIALGNDRFLVNFPGFKHGIAVFFSGKDARGQATNITSGLRTARRLD